MDRPEIKQYRLDELTAFMEKWEEKPFRAKQIWRWLYVQIVSNWSDMTNLSDNLRNELADMLTLSTLSVENVQGAKGKTQKILVGLPDGAAGDGDSAAPGSGFGSSVVRLERHLNRWAGLQSVLQRLPMASPLDSYYVASKYGKRRDPFSKKWAMHNGADLAGRFKSPVWSTAPGKVIFAGRKGPYGKLVAIDHGFGLVTRYGHLRRILVKTGEKIGFRHKIGIMGNTGRSTGSHVHYEVLFEGKPQDPAKFMKAGKYVFKG